MWDFTYTLIMGMVNLFIYFFRRLGSKPGPVRVKHLASFRNQTYYMYMADCGPPQGPSNMGHNNVIKWIQFPCYWPFAREIHWSPVNSPHKGQWRGALMFSLICAWTNGWINHRDAGDLSQGNSIITRSAIDMLWHLNIEHLVIVISIYSRGSFVQ